MFSVQGSPGWTTTTDIFSVHVVQLHVSGTFDLHPRCRLTIQGVSCNVAR